MPILEIERDLDVLYADDDLVLIAKPAWLAAHRGAARDFDTVASRVRRQFGQAHLVHRLDRQTSGAMVIARHTDAARILHEAFDQGDVDKRYVAAVRGAPDEAGDIDHPVPRGEGKDKVAAQTHYERREVVEVDNQLRETRYATVDLSPLTGRYHQLRRHMAHLRHPILGDVNYGHGLHNRWMRAFVELNRMALHARLLDIPHPGGGRLRTEVPLPLDLREPLSRLGFTKLGPTEPTTELTS